MPLRKRCKKFFKSLLQSSTILSIISTLIYGYVRLIGKTTRWKTTGIDEFYKTWDKEGSIIFIGWHGRAMMLPYFWDKTRPMNALVSLHHDGRIIAGILERFGIKTIGGSSTENGRGAALELMRCLKKNEAITIIPDGPKGPSMTLSRSAVYFAQKTGKPIIGGTYSIAGSKIVQKSWDKMLLPKLFSQGRYYVTEPFYIPADTSEDELEEYRKTIENKLNQLTWAADKEMGLEHIEAGTSARKRHPAPNLER